MSNDDILQTYHLISNITHQAINPLNGVIGTLDNLIDGTIQGNRREQRLRGARAQLEYTVSLIRNLAFFAQYSTKPAGDSARSTKTTIIPQVTIEAAMFFQEQAQRNDIRIEVEDRNIQNAVNGDPDLLRQVFMNILDNYVKYGESSSCVKIKHWIQKHTSDLIVEISGASTPFDSDESIFDAGIRGESAKEKTAAGSGLGLHICKLIIEHAFKGRISAQYVSATRLAKFDIRIPSGFIVER